jgi:hypothetical protein
MPSMKQRARTTSSRPFREIRRKSMDVSIAGECEDRVNALTDWSVPVFNYRPATGEFLISTVSPALAENCPLWFLGCHRSFFEEQRAHHHLEVTSTSYVIGLLPPNYARPSNY